MTTTLKEKEEMPTTEKGINFVTMRLEHVKMPQTFSLLLLVLLLLLLC